MIDPCGLLLKVPHLFIVLVLVLWVGCDLDLCQQVHLCDSSLIRWSLKLIDGLLHRMWLKESAKGGNSWYHEHYMSRFFLFDVFTMFLLFTGYEFWFCVFHGMLVPKWRVCDYEATFCPSTFDSMRWLYLKIHMLPVKEMMCPQLLEGLKCESKLKTTKE
jgi:hypothetical protein